MNLYFIKSLFVLGISLIFFVELTDIKIRFYKQLCITIFLTLSSSLVRISGPAFTLAFSYISFSLVLTAFTHIEWKKVFFVSLISFCLSNTIFVSCFFIYCIIISIFTDYRRVNPDMILLLFSGVLSGILSHCICNWNRFKKSIKYLYKEPYVSIIVSLGITILVFLTIPKVITAPNQKTQYIPLLILLAFFLLFRLWKQQTKRYYLSRLRKLELESLRQELKEKDETIKKLMESNDKLARTIHKDNKLIPAMLSAVNDYLSYTCDETTAEQTSHGKALAAQLRQLGCDRMELLAKSARVSESFPQTGNAVVDAMLDYMGKRAEAEKIEFQVKLHPDFSSRIGTEVSEADLTHLLSDLIENALIATKTEDHKSVLVHLGVLYNAPTVEISDTGSPFAPEVYQDFGLSRHSTHLDNGGSGIGLMDIWKLKEKYAVSLHIYEYPPAPEGFTKKICLVFDRKKHYLIRSCRPQELLKVQTRGDLYILPLVENAD